MYVWNKIPVVIPTNTFYAFSCDVTINSSVYANFPHYLDIVKLNDKYISIYGSCLDAALHISHNFLLGQ